MPTSNNTRRNLSRLRPSALLQAGLNRFADLDDGMIGGFAALPLAYVGASAAIVYLSLIHI